jgi:hypothetical protein
VGDGKGRGGERRREEEEKRTWKDEGLVREEGEEEQEKEEEEPPLPARAHARIPRTPCTAPPCSHLLHAPSPLSFYLSPSLTPSLPLSFPRLLVPVQAPRVRI